MDYLINEDQVLSQATVVVVRECQLRSAYEEQQTKQIDSCKKANYVPFSSQIINKHYYFHCRTIFSPKVMFLDETVTDTPSEKWIDLTLADIPALQTTKLEVLRLHSLLFKFYVSQ